MGLSTLCGRNKWQTQSLRHLQIQDPTTLGTVQCFLQLPVGAYGGGASEFQALLYKHCSTAMLENAECLGPYVFVGDESFPLQWNIICLFPRRSIHIHSQQIFNYHLSHAQRIVQNALGLMALQLSLPQNHGAEPWQCKDRFHVTPMVTTDGRVGSNYSCQENLFCEGGHDGVF